MAFVAQFLEVVVVSSTRLRLLYNGGLLASCFGTDALINYKLSGPGIPPFTMAKAALAVPGTNGVEVVFDPPFPPNTTLTIRAENAYVWNGAGGYVLATPVELPFRFGSSPSAANSEVLVTDAEFALYGRDLVWTGADYEETASGDLARVSGVANVQSALYRRLTGAPLPWAPAYSPRAREFVDGNDAGPLRGRILRQALRDNRVRRVTCTVNFDTEPSVTFDVSFELRGGEAPPSLSIAVEN